jgi:hypothetical protein
MLLARVDYRGAAPARCVWHVLLDIRTIVQVSLGGSTTLFAQITLSSTACPGGVGLTTALVVLSGGWVVVGNFPTTDGMSDSMRAGCLIVLNSKGSVVETFSGGNLNGPLGHNRDER